MSSFATIAHLSDLHLVGDITEEGRSLAIKGPKTHSYAKIEALSTAIFEIEELKNTAIDLFVVTGDVTTDGSIESLKTALEFIEERDIYRYTPARRILRGLGASRSSRIVVPGNHDRYAGRLWPLPQQVSNKALEDAFQSPSNYPYAVAFKNPDIDSPLGLLFFVFDSTLVQAGRQDYLNKLARGRIDKGECQHLLEMSAEIKRTGKVLATDGNLTNIDYDRAIKIAVLHHHPVLPQRLTEANMSAYARVKRRLLSGLTLMENADIFVDACVKAEIDFVLFGHQHEDYSVVRLGRSGSLAVRFECCLSTSEYSEKDNGFNLLKFFDNRAEIEQYRWLGERKRLGRFVLVQRRTEYYTHAQASTG